MTSSSSKILLGFVLVLASSYIDCVSSFSYPSSNSPHSRRPLIKRSMKFGTPSREVVTAETILFNSVDKDGVDVVDDSVKKSLEEKMMAWEATEEEVKAATLGGVVPGNRADAFDVGLYIAFPLIVISGLLFAFFPLVMGNIDTSSVGPPPTS